MLKKRLTMLTLVPAVFLVGCALIQLNPAASHVIASPNKAPRGCRYLGQVNGSQGNFFTGGFTANRNLEQGAQNDLRNKASNMGGNYVQLITNRASSTGSVSSNGFGGFSGSQQQTGVTTIGNVYRCPPRAIGE